MNAQDRLKMTLGDLLMQLALAQERIEQLEEEVKQYKAGPQDADIVELRRQ